MLKRHAQLIPQDLQTEPVAPVPNLKAQAHQAVFRQTGIQPQDTIAHLNAGIATLHEIDRASHDSKVNAFLCCPALRIAHIALQCLREYRPRARPV